MKVVLFCGGFGMRLRDFSESIPKPLVPIGYRPILWHVMKYYAHYGYNEFILCLGWKANLIKEYFLKYEECLSNDFVLSEGGKHVSLISSDIQDWQVTFVDTGNNARIGERLKAVEEYLEDEPCFLANYTDGLTDLHLPDLIDFHHQQQAWATFLSVKPTQSFHSVSVQTSGQVAKIQEVSQADIWVNGGFFVFSREFLNYLREGEDLVDGPFQRLIEMGRLSSLTYDGFWGCMDTYKEKQTLDEMYDRGESVWAVWENGRRHRRRFQLSTVHQPRQAVLAR
jgi:glucose-1-phosphate cytidylyltransferase